MKKNEEWNSIYDCHKESSCDSGCRCRCNWSASNRAHYKWMALPNSVSIILALSERTPAQNLWHVNVSVLGVFGSVFGYAKRFANEYTHEKEEKSAICLCGRSHAIFNHHVVFSSMIHESESRTIWNCAPTHTYKAKTNHFILSLARFCASPATAVAA